MALHIIDNKPIDLTDIEWDMYQKLCVSYDQPPSLKGKDLFVDLFEVDSDGLILYLKPPKRQISFEIVFFLFSVLQAQQIRRAQGLVDAAIARLDAKLEELSKKK